jgi:hypothetical protein
MQSNTAPQTENGNQIELIIGGKTYAGFEQIEPKHRRTLFTLLNFRDPKDERRLVPFSFTEFCARRGLNRHSQAAAEALQFLQALLAGSMRTTDPRTGVSKQLPLFAQATIIERDNP